LMFNQTAWEVLGEDAVPASDAVRESGWHLVPQGQLTLLGVTLSDVELWLGEDHLGIYFVGTGQLGGVSATSSNTFTQWGGPVALRVPAAGRLRRGAGPSRSRRRPPGPRRPPGAAGRRRAAMRSPRPRPRRRPARRPARCRSVRRRAPAARTRRR